MANSKYEYVRLFEQPDAILPNTWIVIRIDGRGFHKLTAKYCFEKPNDERALNLMNAAAAGVLSELPDVVVAYGVSDEFSFVLHKGCSLFERRSSKLTTTIVSSFTAYYVSLWPVFLPDSPLSAPLPTFDGRAVAYPSVQNLRDYMSWRQVDCHINNLYNTTFWALVQQGGLTEQEAEKRLNGTTSADKNELLFSEFGINYNNQPEMFRKGSVLYREYEILPPVDLGSLHIDVGGNEETQYMEEFYSKAPQSKTAAEKDRKTRAKAKIAVQHIDLIKDDFWERRPWILSGKAGKLPTDRQPKVQETAQIHDFS